MKKGHKDKHRAEANDAVTTTPIEPAPPEVAADPVPPWEGRCPVYTKTLLDADNIARMLSADFNGQIFRVYKTPDGRGCVRADQRPLALINGARHFCIGAYVDGHQLHGEQIES